MSIVKVAAFGISLDGYAAGPGQDLAHPLGHGGEALMRWVFPTSTFQRMHTGAGEGTTGIDNDFAARGFTNIGAWILGRNMFGPVRGPWTEPAWRGWWGETPPYHTPVFVLTHHARPPLEMSGGTIFHFMDGRIEDVVEHARQAAAGRDVRVGGGVATVRACLAAGLIDEMHLAAAPVLLGAGEALFSGLDLPTLGYAVDEHVQGEAALHVTVRRRAAAG